MLEPRPYVNADWRAVLDLCLRAFAPACQALERLLGTELDWRGSIEGHLRSLTRRGAAGRLVVVEQRGSLVGVVHYQVDRETRSGSIGVSAVDPARQRQGIGSLMYAHVLERMSAQGARYATADTGADASNVAARRAYEKAGFVGVPTVHYFMALPRPARRVPGRGPRRSPGNTKRISRRERA
jgi:ribosomal protein S18 acetylase RimI-like enzyme